jgi:hypothetical protein
MQSDPRIRMIFEYLDVFKQNPRPPITRHTLLASVVVIGVTALAAVILWVVTEWLWLVVHEGLR